MGCFVRVKHRPTEFYGTPPNLYQIGQVTAYDFVDTNEKGFNLDIWYKSTYSNNTAYVPIAIQGVLRSLNAASNAFLKFLKGAGVTMEFEFVKETPKAAMKNMFDISSLLGPLFFTWIVQLLLSVLLDSSATHLLGVREALF